MKDVFGDRLKPALGWHGLELDPVRFVPFRWVEKRSALDLIDVDDGSILCLDVLSVFPDYSASLLISGCDGESIHTIRLKQDRKRYFVPLPTFCINKACIRINFSADCELESADKPGDHRQLAIRFYNTALYSSTDQLAQSEWMRVPTGPKVLTIEPTTRCNLKCIMCRHTANHIFPKRPEELPQKYIEKIIKLAERSESLVLHGWGEPLLSESFYLLVDKLGKSPSRIGFNTNGSLVDERILGPAAKRYILSINFSLDAATERTYQSIRNYDFRKIVANIKKVLVNRAEAGIPFPNVYINMTLMRRNIEEAPLFVDLGHELGVDAVFFWHLCDHKWLEGSNQEWLVGNEGASVKYSDELLKNEREKSNRLLRAALNRAESIGMRVVVDHSRRMYFPDDESYVEEPAGMQSFFEEPRYCSWPWEELLVRTDGSVWFCCSQNKGYQDIPLGNLEEVDDLEEFWNSPEIQSARASVSFNRLPRHCVDVPCKYNDKSILSRKG
jgi:MoaA/NifB/PqqE/SkfB family radical SAM enzyme